MCFSSFLFLQDSPPPPRISVCRICKLYSLDFLHQQNYRLDIKIKMYLYIHIIFTNPSAWAGYDTKSIFKRSLTGLNSEFSISENSCLTKAEEPSLLYYLPIAGGRIIGFIPFPRVLVLCEMQLVLSRIWTRVAMSIYSKNRGEFFAKSKIKFFSEFFLHKCKLSIVWNWIIEKIV